MQKLTEEEFIFRAIKRLRGKYKGIHSVYSGFNQAFRQYFGTNPVEATKRLHKDKKIIISPVKGGVMLFLPEEKSASPEDILKKFVQENE